VLLHKGEEVRLYPGDHLQVREGRREGGRKRGEKAGLIMPFFTPHSS
jgi:hypothetical protein